MFRGIIWVFVILAGLLSADFISAQVVINEIAWMGTETSANDEWLELYNETVQDVNLDGWLLKAADGAPEIRLEGIISAESFFLLERTDDSTVPDVLADQLYKGALINSGEHLQLYDSEGNLEDFVDCASGWFAGDNQTKQTMERSQLPGSHPGDWGTSQNPGGTPRAQNSAAIFSPPLEEPVAETGPAPQLPPESQITEEYQSAPASSTAITKEIELSAAASLIEKEMPAPETETVIYVSGIVINEILPSPEGPDAEEEWIELYNQNNEEADLSLWRISDAVGSIKTHTFSRGAIIPAQGFLVLERPETGITLNNSGDGLELLRPDGVAADAVVYPKASRGRSYNRLGFGWQWSDILTPGGTNTASVSSGAPFALSETEPGSAEEREKNEETDSFLSKTAQLAAAGSLSEEEQASKSLKSFYLFAVAFGIAAFSSGIIIFLKRNLKS